MRERSSFIPSEQINPRQEMESKGKEYSPETKSRLTGYISTYWRGDAHTHSAESSREGWGYAEGIYDEKEIIKYYQELGLEFVAFAEHASNPGKPEKLDENSKICQDILKQVEKIKQINQEGEFNTAAFSSIETNVLFDEGNKATVDLPKNILNKLDLVIASRHAIKNEKDIEAIKASLLSTIDNPNIDVIGHPDRYIQLKQGVVYRGEPCPPEIYWQTWDEILNAMATNGKAFEVNFNNQPNEKLLKMAAEKGVKFMLNYDAHDFNQYKKGTPEGDAAKQKWAKDEASKEDLEILQKYKLERLTSGPGVKAILRLVKTIKKLEEWGVIPERIINSSRENMINFLTTDRKKSTENLEFLKRKYNLV